MCKPLILVNVTRTISGGIIDREADMIKQPSTGRVKVQALVLGVHGVCVCVCVCVCVRACVRACVCVCVRERERERECV